jgi:hypothetical protein
MESQIHESSTGHGSVLQAAELWNCKNSGIFEHIKELSFIVGYIVTAQRILIEQSKCFTQDIFKALKVKQRIMPEPHNKTRQKIQTMAVKLQIDTGTIWRK